MAGRVLVVEDDHGLRDVVARGLREHGFTVVTAVDGRDVCQAMRAAGMTSPILFLTARGEVGDRLSGFAAGGDDYLAKPFHIAELVARLEVAVRRSAGAAVTPAEDVGDLRADPATHDLTGPTGTTALSPTEFRLLTRLLAPPRAVVRRQELIAAAWAHGSLVADNTLDQYVAKLRRKLAEVGTSQRIATARGVGYRIS